MNTKPLNIFLADDDKDDRFFFEKALKELAIAALVKTFEDGEKLMAYLLDKSHALPDVLFLDISMPRKNGYECLSEITQSEELKAIPVVMLSTANAQETISTFFRNGAHIYIHKPGDFAQLKQVIHHALPIAAEKIIETKHVKYILNA